MEVKTMFKPEMIVHEAVIEKTIHGDYITVAKDVNGKRAFGACCVIEPNKCLLKYFPTRAGAKRALKDQRTPQFGG
jgi:hypothetical protein